MTKQATEINEANLAAIGVKVVESLADAQLLGCAACLRKSNDYTITVGIQFDAQNSMDMSCYFSALCGECLNAARAFGKTKRA